MKIHDHHFHKILGEIEVTEQEAFVLGEYGMRVEDSRVLQAIFSRIWHAAYAKGLQYDPREQSPRDPDGLVGPSDAESIGRPWCPWCRKRAHFGACKES